jgi:hypothetical protein
VWGGGSELEVARQAVDPSPRNARGRASLAPYIAQFLSYFRAEVLLPRLFTAITTGVVGSEAACLADLNTVLQDLLTSAAGPEVAGSDSEGSDGGSGGEEGVDVRYWVWDLEADGGPQFRVDAARRLFGAIGVLREGPLAPM